LYLVDRLESILSAGLRVPLTNKAIIDEQALLDAIDQMRITIPEEIKQAKRISQDRERLLANAQAEADQVLASARERAAYLLQDKELSKSAEIRAQGIIDEARKEGQRIQGEADGYSIRVLGELVNELYRQQQTAQNGIEVLKRRIAAGQAPAPPAAPQQKK
jgi:F0F1-type ATP synthase membrane subunit b/b'